jgi:RNA methyltransferase, TrmH family
MTVITSSSNQRIKDIRKLRDRKYRLETGLAWVEGLRACGDAFTRPENIQQVVVCPESLHSDFADELINKARSINCEILEIGREVFNSLSGKENPQGFGVVVRQSFIPLSKLDLKADDLWVALDRVADPGNLGTILRTLDGCGGKGLVLLDNCTDPYDPTAIRASTGAVFHLDLIKTDTASFSIWKQESKVHLTGAVAVPGAQDYHFHHYNDPLIMIMGSEREGLTPELTMLCDSVVSIPMVGHIDSLNLAEATAIILYEIFNQHRSGNEPKGERA